jgi:hypothetical protein
MGHQEEIKSAIDDFRLLNEASVDISSLRWVGDGTLSAAGAVSAVAFLSAHLEEALTDSLIYNDESGLG